MVPPPHPVNPDSFTPSFARQQQHQQHPQGGQGASNHQSNNSQTEADIVFSVMEQQAGRHTSDDLSTATPLLTESSSDDSLSKSVPCLRFPIPQGNSRLANWVSTSSPDIMAPSSSHDGDYGLSESAFEFVPRDTADDGSQDERTDSISESLSELERYPHPDEVQAFGGLDDMSTSTVSTCDSEEEDEHGQDEDDSFLPSRRANHILQSSLAQGSFARPFYPTSRADLSDESIEFGQPEDGNVHIDKISVKHTIREFTEEEAAQFRQTLHLDGTLERLCATIRQTMSQQCLSTHEAFRVLYTGDEEIKPDIILKISRAITCSSAVDYNENKTLRRNTEGVYNIVPVTFGTIKDRDVELMEASGFQIKVDTCLEAEKIPIEGRFFREDIIYSLTVCGGNGGKKYKSVPAAGPEGARVQPAWSLPHIAVFFCSEHDGEDIQRIQQTTWEFCERHAIPALFIADHPVFTTPTVGRWLNYTNEHAVHLSLESRDLKVEQRFPIDLNSFLNIDNRQMNQNLAYITGLQEPTSVADEKMRDVISLSGSEQDLSDRETKSWKSYTTRPMESFLGGFSYREVFRTLAVVLVATASVSLMGSMLKLPIFSSQQSPAGVSPADPLSSTLRATAITTATVTISHTSTKTVRLASAETPLFGGLLSDIAHTVSSEGPRSTDCSVRLYSNTEILIRLPQGTKETWLAKGAIDVDVYRGQDQINSRLSSIKEGIIIQIPDKEAHGVLNVSVVTTRKPKINETFAIDFGMPTYHEALKAAKDKLQEVAMKFGQTAHGAFYAIENEFSSFCVSADEQLKDAKTSIQNAITDSSQIFQGLSLSKAAKKFEWTKGFKSPIHPDEFISIFKDARENAQKKLTDNLRHVEDIREDTKLAILQAQINSKLWWLKLQGKAEEYDEYERQGRAFLSSKYSEVVNAKKMRSAPKCPRTGSSTCGCKHKVLGRWKV